MDIKYGLDYRKKNYDLFTINGISRYDYAKNGLLDKCLPKILFKGNSILVTFLLIIENKIIMILKYVDKVKKFKYISSYY